MKILIRILAFAISFAIILPACRSDMMPTAYRPPKGHVFNKAKVHRKSVKIKTKKKKRSWHASPYEKKRDPFW